jgi:hypothetical protein
VPSERGIHSSTMQALWSARVLHRHSSSGLLEPTRTRGHEDVALIPQVGSPADGAGLAWKSAPG